MKLTKQDIKKYATLREQKYLTESRFGDAMDKYPGREEEINYFHDNDPSGTDKYLGWALNFIIRNENVSPGEVMEFVQKHKQSRLFKQPGGRDIHSIKTLDDLRQF